MSLGVMGVAKAALVQRSMPAAANGPARIKKTSYQKPKVSPGRLRKDVTHLINL
jgi:hypothetical protein